MPGPMRFSFPRGRPRSSRMHFAPRFPGALAADGAPSLMKENGVTFPFTACKRHYMRETRCCQGLFLPSPERAGGPAPQAGSRRTYLRKAAEATRSLAPPPHYKRGWGWSMVDHGNVVLIVLFWFCRSLTPSWMIAGWFSLAATEPPSPLWIVEPLKCRQN